MYGFTGGFKNSFLTKYFNRLTKYIPKNYEFVIVYPYIILLFYYWIRYETIGLTNVIMNQIICMLFLLIVLPLPHFYFRYYEDYLFDYAYMLNIGVFYGFLLGILVNLIFDDYFILLILNK